MIGIWNGEIINFDFMMGNLDALGGLSVDIPFGTEPMTFTGHRYRSPLDRDSPDEPIIINKE